MVDKQERGVSKGNPQHNRGVVCVTVRIDCQNFAFRSTQGKGFVLLGNCQRNIVFFHGFPEILECLGVISGDGRIRSLDTGIVQSTGKASDVILMSMGSDDIIQLRDFVILHHGVHLAGICRIAAINQHEMSITLDECGICLSHIQKGNLQFAVAVSCLRWAWNTDNRKCQAQGYQNQLSQPCFVSFLFHRVPLLNASLDFPDATNYI